ncbi:sensor histidine kinase [Proteiniclasticum ruminis]|uniref:histidine kinase n=1 Tax=Proteiniclasticum ruminis TaxID=398199 RepID=A0A1G8LR39_9CLOT|nr:sensor histidine kinase [Proteiniclasticum ruminis]SDI58085.1 Signal transduction histidine kinase [Proteiniclasticum ruminis]
MKLFLKDNKAYITTYFIGTVITILYCELMNYIERSDIFYLIIVNSFILLCFLAIRYHKTQEIYKLFENGLNSSGASNTTLGTTVIGKNLSGLLNQQHRRYQGEIQEYDKKQKEHLAFINTWVHQMKTPLSIIQLQLEEYGGEPLAEEISEEVRKINKSLNLALYLARVEAFEKDYVIEKLSLRQLVVDAVNNEKKLFIKSRIIPKVDIDGALEIHTDGKWLKFVLEQIITNGIKYAKGKGKTMYFSGLIKENNIILEVIDEGIGIPEKDLKRVYDPFFTGENGRNHGESTGMGLYIVKRICEHLNHKVEIESKSGKGTTLRLIFSKTDEFNSFQ